MGHGRMTQWSTQRPEGRRARALAAGVALIAVPTVFTVMPSWTDWHWAWRTLILVAWLAVAAAIVWAEMARGEKLESLTADRAQLLRNLRMTGLTGVLTALLRSGTRDMPDSYEFTLYLYDEGSRSLIPRFPRLTPTPDPDPRIFMPGNGATGSCWEDEDVVVVRGEDVSSEAYGLTPIQQAHYAGYQSVAAAVVWQENIRKIGVVTAISKDDDRYFEAESSRDSLRILANVLGVVLQRIPEPADLTEISVGPQS